MTMYTEPTASLPKNPAAHTLPTILGLALFAVSGCTAAEVSPTAKQWAHCEPSTFDIDALPDDVLAGTDIVDSASFEDDDASLAGQYQGESGGAMIGAMISREYVIRQFEEPGIEPDNRTFQPVCIEGPYLFAEGLVARRVTEGLLFLERDSAVGGIPSDTWLLLKPLQ